MVEGGSGLQIPSFKPYDRDTYTGKISAVSGTPMRDSTRGSGWTDDNLATPVYYGGYPLEGPVACEKDMRRWLSWVRAQY